MKHLLNRSFNFFVGVFAITLLTLLDGTVAKVAFANVVHASNGVVSTRSPLATEAGIDALKQGGNAVDAIVASAFALAVTYPSAGNLGGGGFFVIRFADGTVAANDHREVAPLAATRDMFLDDQGDYDPIKALRSRLSSGVPGSVAGLLDVHKRYGRLSRQQVLARAIELAEKGLKLPADIARQIAGRESIWKQHPSSAKKFLDERHGTYSAGDLFVQSDLASTLKRIDALGHEGFYEGQTANFIVREMENGGGLITHEDLKKYRSVWREPIYGTYRGHEIFSMPPPSSGGVLLVQMLNMLEYFNVSDPGYGDPDLMHLMIEIERRAYADRAKYLGDSDFYPVPISTLIDKTYAKTRIRDLNRRRTSASEQIQAGSINVESEETTHLSAIDGEGNAVALTTTLNSGYGNGIVVGGAGFLLNNEMDDFSSKPGVPNQFGLVGAEANAIEPRKRMLSSMTPTIVVKDGKPLLVTGSPGGSTIMTTVLQVVVNVIDHRMLVDEAVTKPRFHHQWLPDAVTVETGGFPQATLDALAKYGHDSIQLRRAIGDANSAMMHDDVFIGVSDPRNAGKAAGIDETYNSDSEDSKER